jgi:hypothetical protein
MPHTYLKIIESKSTTSNPIKNLHVVDESRLLQIDHHPIVVLCICMRTDITRKASTHNLPIYKPRKCPTIGFSKLKNARDRTPAGAARAREVDEAGGVGEACVAGAAGPLGRSARQLRVTWTLRGGEVREAQQEAQQEDQSIQPRAAARVTAHVRGV